MKFAQRLKLYGFGFLLGLLILAIILKGKQCDSPADIKLQELANQRMEISALALCKLKCLGIDEKKIKTELLSKARVNYKMSEVQAVPYGKYFVEGTKKSNLGFTVVIRDCDTLSKIDDINLLSKVCDCK